MKLESFSRDDLLLGAVALLLAIDLLFLPWFSISLGPFTFTATATDAPDGWLGILAVLAALGLTADLAVERLSPQTSVPAIGGSRTQTRMVLTAVTALFVALKFLFHVHFSLFGFGFWLAAVLTAGLVYCALRARSGEPILGASRSGD
ncbi:MAG: hypothetical protein ACRDL5_01870 [Solirubrobacteraceae bacterium]